MSTNLRDLPAVVYAPTRRLHSAYAAGGPLDGSLYGFYTLCHRRIGDEEVWREIKRSSPYRDEVLWPAGRPVRPVLSCKQCQHIIDRDSDAA